MTAKAAAKSPQLPECEKGLPANTEAERTILGAILLDNARYTEISAMVSADDFSLHAHRELFDMMGRMIKDGVAVDAVTMVEELYRTPALMRLQGAAYCSDLIVGLPRRLCVVDYCRIVREKAKLRRLMGAVEQVWKKAQEPGVVSIDIGRDLVRDIKAIFKGR